LPDIKTIQEQIRTRLGEVETEMEPLRVEAEQLTQMLKTFGAELGSTTTPSATRTSKGARKAPTRSTGAKRGRPLGSGNRAQQAVAKINEQPGITASELAKSMGISPNYLYRVLPRLEREAKVYKEGRGYHPAGDAATTAPTNGQPVTA
jgi:hypothetical protein